MNAPVLTDQEKNNNRYHKTGFTRYAGQSIL